MPTSYSYNLHNHVKIWLSNKPSVFMNTENQVRLIEMRETNPSDTIHLVYDSSLLNTTALQDLEHFCKEHRIIAIDANSEPFKAALKTKEDKQLYAYYQDEIQHLQEGGNLAVASDIIRWIPPVYSKGTYTDFDVPVDTHNIPAHVSVEAPLLLNIGSLQTQGKEVILSNNDYIAIVDPVAAKKDIENIQKGFIEVLGRYSNDFMERTEKEFGGSSIINRYIVDSMKSRSESIYIERSKSAFNDTNRTSRELRHHVHQIMTNQDAFIAFKQKTVTNIKEKDTQEVVVKKLRAQLASELSTMKWLFFKKEYHDIKTAVTQFDDNQLLAYLMKKERTLYLKSIVVCTTGPIAISKFLFHGYVVDSSYFSRYIQQFSFNNYRFKDIFQSKNSIPMHERPLGMMRFLGTQDGELNDSSWLESGATLQQSRTQTLNDRKVTIKDNLSNKLTYSIIDIEQHIERLRADSHGLFSQYIGRNHREAKIKALHDALSCFKEDPAEFNTTEFRQKRAAWNPSQVYAGLLSSHTKKLLDTLEDIRYEAIIFGLTKDRKLTYNEPLYKTLKSQNYRDNHPSQYNISLEKDSGYDTLTRTYAKQTLWQRLLSVVKNILSIPTWIFSCVFSRLITHIALDPTHTKLQKPVHLVYLSDDKDAEEVVVINLIPHDANKTFHDYLLKFNNSIMTLPFMKTVAKRQLSLHHQKDKQYVDHMLTEIDALLNGQSTIKQCENKTFLKHQLYFKGLEGLSSELKTYFFSVLKEKHGIHPFNQNRELNLDFFTLKTPDGAVLDSVEISIDKEKEKPMHERKFIITCLPQQQNYINRIKDCRESAQKIDATLIGFNFRGIDYSQGMVWTQKNMVDDVKAQAERLLALGAKAENIGIEGTCIGGAIATLAAAQLHEHGCHVKLYNERSFRTLARFLSGYILPEKNNWLNPITYARYLVAGLVHVIFTPFLKLTGWFIDAAGAWNEIPFSDKAYSVVHQKGDVTQQIPDVTDGIVHDTWASMASLVNENRACAQQKKTHGVTLNPDEEALLSSDPDDAHFTSGAGKKEFDCPEVAKLNGEYPHFCKRNNLFKVHGTKKETMHDYMAENFKHMLNTSAAG
ncbi:MAG: glycosyltransferase family 88 protein [Legionellaceae bacterium]|nr:glycosyltransferase family 88 protein [Legionellaceae bacterium]